MSQEATLREYADCYVESPRMPVLSPVLGVLFAYPSTPDNLDAYMARCTYGENSDLYSKRTGTRYSPQAAGVVLGQWEK